MTIYNANKIKTGSSGFDLSMYTNLKELNIQFCSLKNLDISNNRKLTRLDILHNNFEKIDLSNNKDIQTLVLDFNNFSVIDIKNNTKTEYLDIGFNPCTEFYFTTLKNFICESTRLTKLSSLKYPDCRNNKLDSLDITNNPETSGLHCEGNKIKELDISKCPCLKSKLVNPNLQYDNGITIKTKPDIPQ